MPNARCEKPKRENLPAPGNVEGANQAIVGKQTLPTATYGNDYQRLLIALRDAPAGALLFIQLNSPVQRRQLPTQLKADGLQRSFSVADFARLPAGPPPYRVLREFLEELSPRPELLFVDGLEYRIETNPETIEELNLGRERLANLGVVVIFLLPAYVIDLIRSRALNLWSWRAHHYVLEPPDDLRRQDGAILSFETGRTIPAGDTPEARDRRIRILQRLLTEDLAENRSPESLLRSVLLPLARELYDAGRFAEALAVLDQLKNYLVNREDSPSKREILNLQALAFLSLGSFDEAEPVLQHVLALSEKVLGPEHPDTATSLNNMATLYEDQGRYTQAESLHQRALGIREKVLGPEHLDTAQSLNNLAENYRNQGRYTQAESLHQRALAIYEKMLGPEHPNTAMSLNNLALLYHNQGRYAHAELLCQRALAICEKMLGPEHPNTAMSLNNLALLYHNQGRYAHAEPLYQRALAIREKVLGLEHSDTATSLNNLAGLYESQSLYAQAEILYRRALAIWEKSLGSEHPHVATGLENYARLLRKMNREVEAEKLEARARVIREKQEREA